MGKEFEVMCQEYVWNHASDFVPEVFISNVGKWRGQDNVKKQPADIDVVGIDEMGKTAVIGECKFKHEPIGEKEYETLRGRARLIRPYEVRNYLLFSLSGFKSGLKVSDDTHLASLKDMYPVR